MITFRNKSQKPTFQVCLPTSELQQPIGRHNTHKLLMLRVQNRVHHWNLNLSDNPPNKVCVVSYSIGPVKEYPTMHCFGIPRHTQPIIAKKDFN